VQQSHPICSTAFRRALLYATTRHRLSVVIVAAVRLAGPRPPRYCLTNLGGVGLLHQARRPFRQRFGQVDIAPFVGNDCHGEITSGPITQHSLHPARPSRLQAAQLNNMSLDKKLLCRLPDIGGLSTEYPPTVNAALDAAPDGGNLVVVDCLLLDALGFGKPEDRWTISLPGLKLSSVFFRWAAGLIKTAAAWPAEPAAARAPPRGPAAAARRRSRSAQPRCRRAHRGRHGRSRC
jgi:hypothetical protein